MNDPLIETTPGAHYGETVTINRDLPDAGAVAGHRVRIVAEGFAFHDPAIDPADIAAHVRHGVASWLNNATDARAPTIGESVPQDDGTYRTWISVALNGKLGQSFDGAAWAAQAVRASTSADPDFDGYSFDAGGDGGVYLTDLEDPRPQTFKNQQQNYNAAPTSAFVGDALKTEGRAVGSVASSAGDLVGSAAAGLASGVASGLGVWLVVILAVVIIVVVAVLAYSRSAV
jgi:hypothetical protein